MIKLLLVDDHELVRIGIRSLLAGIDGIEVMGEVNTGEEALALAHKTTPDVVLMDLKMPGIGGLEATRNLLEISPEIKVIIVTVCDEDPFPSRLLQAGASGYLTKGCDLNEMVMAIRKVHSGQRYISPTIAQQLALKHLTTEPDAVSPFESLSDRELQVTLMITKGLKVQGISEKLGLSTKTINTYRYRLFDKLKIEGDVELTHLALRHNILDKEDKKV